jgi:arsenite/tail-anchored protein-transporting ATPase
LFLFFGGKGGVGKTTCAAARAIAEAARGNRVLVVSTDPAHSLGDALRKKLSARVTVVAQAFPPALARVSRELRRGSPKRHRREGGRPADAGLKPRATSTGALYALELDARRAFARWLREHRRPLGDILEQGTWLDREDVEELLDLSIPGIDELVGLLEITRLSRSGLADLIVVDTAPTGHTLRLLASPETVGAVASVLDALHEEHRLIRDQLARVGRPEASDRLIELLAEQARDMAAHLHDARCTRVHWVTLPEELSVYEASDAVPALARSGLHVDAIIVNRVLPDGGPCPLCDRRRSLEDAVIKQIARGIGRGREVRVVPAEIREPTGVKALAKIGRALTASARKNVGADLRVGPRGGRRRALRFGVPRRSLAESGQAKAGHMGPPLRNLSNQRHTTPPETMDAFKGVKLLFFGGKGGVGKTTVAAATALRFASADATRRILLMSTDPAHSLGDVFAAKVGDSPRPIAGGPRNLLVQELDAARAWATRRAAVEAAVDDLAAAVGSGGMIRTRTRVSELIDLAPPGVDELFGVLSVFEARDEHDVIVIDTAPTGHALRLLGMPDVVRDWAQALLRVLLKYRALVRPGQLAAELVDMSRSTRELRLVLRNRQDSRFIVVTRPAEVPGAETSRLLRRLRSLHLAVPAIVANALTLSPGRCRRCRAISSAERRHLRALSRAFGPSALSERRVRRVEGCVIIQTPLSAPPPRGAKALTQWGARWIADLADR